MSGRRAHPRAMASTTGKESRQMSAKRTMKRVTAALLGAIAAALTIGALAAPAMAAEPVLRVDSTHVPAVVPAGSHVKYTLALSNTGSEETSGPLTLDFDLPPGMEVRSVSAEKYFGTYEVWDCSTTPDSQSVSCEGLEVELFPGYSFSVNIEPGQEACGGTCRVTVIAKVDSTVSPGLLEPGFEACGGGASSCFAGTDPTQIGPPAEFGLTGFDGEVLREDGEAATRAGSRPYTAATEFSLGTSLAANGETLPTGELQDAIVKLPPGLAGNPQATTTCTQTQLAAHLSGGGTRCPNESQVGTVRAQYTGAVAGLSETLGVYNMELPQGTAAVRSGSPAVLGFNVQGVRVEVYVKLRTGEDYGVTVITKNAPQTYPIGHVDFVIWGVPADPSHDAQRFCSGVEGSPKGCSSEAALRPFFTLPTSCAGPGPNNSLRTSLEVTSWEGGSDGSSFLSHAPGEPESLIGGTGCDEVPFEPELEARPTTNVADSASGLDVDLHIPQHEECEPNPSAPPEVLCETASAQLRDTTVTLPEGLVVNPSGANGLDGCSEAQFGYTSTDPDGTIHTTPGPATCPDASKQGSVEIDTPLLDHPLKGAVYLANPYANPFHSLLALYIAVDDPRTGIVVKLAGEVHLDPNTGRITATFDRNPQQPFEDFKLRFFGGAGGALRTPATCGNHTTTSDLTPWTAPEGETKHPADTWAITQSPGGGCVTSTGSEPNSPSFDAGTVTPVAGAYSPFVIHLRREDGSQEFSAVDVSPPPGLIGKLADIPYCSDAALAAAAGRSGNDEKAHPDCSEASKLGTVDVAAGAGPAPYHAQAAAYLAGPYKGAPLSMAIVTPATAGPFDLGTVVTRVALQIDPQTAQITAKSDPIPHILEGIPLDVRAVNVELDREKFTKNPTSCEAMSVGGGLLSTLNQSVSLKQRFQLGECANLKFKPLLGLRLKGPVKRAKNPRLVTTLAAKEGEADIGAIQVTLPRSAFLDQSHIRTVCTRVQWAADACPAGSVYGRVSVDTPILGYPLTGKVYLRSSSHKLPDLVLDLRGPASQPIRIELAGRTDSVHGALRNTFDFVPDAPFSRARLELFGGKRGLIVNSRNVCANTYRAKVAFTAHDGDTLVRHPKLRPQCRHPRRHKRHGRHRRRGAKTAAAHGSAVR